MDMEEIRQRLTGIIAALATSGPADYREKKRYLTGLAEDLLGDLTADMVGCPRAPRDILDLRLAGVEVTGEPLLGREALELRSPPTQARCRCCSRLLTDVQSIAAGEGPLCREGRCRKKAG